MVPGLCRLTSSRYLLNLVFSNRVGTAPVLVVGGVPEIANFYKDKVTHPFFVCLIIFLLSEIITLLKL